MIKTNEQENRLVVQIEVQYIATNSFMACSMFNMNEYLTEHQILWNLIRKNGILFECSAIAPAPSKDYGHLQILIDKIIFRCWKITLRNVEGSLYPSEIKNSYEDFFHDEIAQREIMRIFGKQTLEYCFNYLQGHIDWFSHLPLDIQIRIFSFVNLEDIPQLALVSKLFRLICRQNDLWKLFYIRQYGINILDNQNLIFLAEKRGWKNIFFTNRLKLKLELRRIDQLNKKSSSIESD